MRLLHRLVTIVLAALLVAAAWLPVSNSFALEHAEAGLKRALASYAVARALNAVISVAQGTEIAIQPGGMGVVTTPGQALDPVNDLVEQFSSLMLAAAVAFGLQMLLIKIGAHWVFSSLLTLAALAWAAAMWRDAGSPRWLTTALLVLALARFAVPLTALVSEGVFRAFMADDYQVAQGEISHSSERIRPGAQKLDEASGAAEKESSWLPKIPDLRRVPADIMAAIERSVRHMIELVVIFMLQTVVVPLAVLWGLLGLGRGLATGIGPARAAH